MNRDKKHFPILWVLILCIICCVCTVSAFMFRKEDTSVVITPADVQCTLYETEDAGRKSDVYVENTGNFPCYIRVSPVAYYTYSDGSIAGKGLAAPSLDLNDGWISIDGIYYYTEPIYPYEYTGSLCSPITLTDSTDDQGTAVSMKCDFVAEAIQAESYNAVTLAWDVELRNGSITAK